ncbi:MAG: hypothetical protein WA629_04675 [Candidatus Aquilonibacter sp.]
MIAWFESLPLIPGAIVVVGGFVIISILLARLAAHVARPELLMAHNELTGFVFAVVGVIYALVLGFVMVGVWERFEAAEARTFDESSSLTAVYRDAGSFANATLLRSDVRTYVEAIIHDGWPDMQAGRHSFPTAISAEVLAREVERTRLRDGREAALYPLMASALNEALLDRDARLALDTHGLYGIMWWTVFVGGFVTIAFTYLFGFRRTVMQTAMVGTLAFLIGLVIFLTMSLDYPFRGAVYVAPEAFERALHVFGHIDTADPLSAKP